MIRPVKKKSGWYSYQNRGRSHWWDPWEANDYFMNSRCGRSVFCTALYDDPSHHRCKRCARYSRASALSAVVTYLKAKGKLDATRSIAFNLHADLRATGELDAAFGQNHDDD